MRILICPNAFKGSLTAGQAAAALARGGRRGGGGVEVRELPLADGGDGTLAVLLRALGGEEVSCWTRDPWGRPLLASYGVLVRWAGVVELAQASGLARLLPTERDPEQTSTEGTGILIRAALERGCRELLITLGGSATNDGGMGIAHALGFRFLAADGQALPPKGGSLLQVASMDASQVLPAVWDTRFRLLCDVNNPLLGSRGAVAVFGPQKGATPEQQARLEQGLARWAALIGAEAGVDIRHLAGAGAAGGVGGGLVALLGASIESGTDFILQTLELERWIAWADLVITGEGHLDPQSQMGKLFGGIQALCQRYGKPLWVIVGQGALPGVKVSRVMDLAADLESAMQRADHYLEALAYSGIGEFLHPSL
ncbi:MAG: glycerate kinase [Thermostichales cyanobacterium DRC_bins_46]